MVACIYQVINEENNTSFFIFLNMPFFLNGSVGMAFAVQ
jgi:hypothetical protein